MNTTSTPSAKTLAYANRLAHRTWTGSFDQLAATFASLDLMDAVQLGQAITRMHAQTGS